MAKNKKNTEECAEKAEINSKSSEVNKKDAESALNETVTSNDASKKKKKRKHQKAKTTAKTDESNSSPALKENGKKEKDNMTTASTGDEPAKKKQKQKHKKEVTTTPNAEESNSSPASKENGKNRKRKISEGNAKSEEKNETKPTDKESDKSSASKVRKPRHSGREERKLLKAQQKAEGTFCEAKVAKKKKRKRSKRGKDGEKAKEVISGEDEATAEEKAKLFLDVWHTNKTEWSFLKIRQNWLVHHMYDTEKIPDATFKILLEYLSGMRGHSRDETKAQAQNMVDIVTKEKNELHKRIKLSGDPGAVQQARAEQVIDILK